MMQHLSQCSPFHDIAESQQADLSVCDEATVSPSHIKLIHVTSNQARSDQAPKGQPTQQLPARYQNN